MNATDFIKQHGVEKARKVVEGAPEAATAFNIVSGSIIYYQLCDNWWWYNPLKKEWEMDYSKSMRINLSDLKRIVESVDLVEHFGNDIGGAKQLLEFSKGCKTIELSGSVITIDRLEQAIADYESIYSNDMGDNTHIENHVSPNCKKFEEQVGNNETK